MSYYHKPIIVEGYARLFVEEELMGCDQLDHLTN